MKRFPAGQFSARPIQQFKRTVEGVADIAFGVATYTPAIFPKTKLAIPPGKADNSQDATEHLADEFADVKMIGLTTAAEISIAATRDVSTMEGLKGANIVPYPR